MVQLDRQFFSPSDINLALTESRLWAGPAQVFHPNLQPEGH